MAASGVADASEANEPQTVLDMSGEALVAIRPELLHPQLVELCLMYNRIESIESLELVPRLQVWMLTKA